MESHSDGTMGTFHKSRSKRHASTKTKCDFGVPGSSELYVALL